MPSRRQLLALILLSTVLVVAILWLLRLAGFEERIIVFLKSLQESGGQGYLLFALAVIVAVLTLLPSVVLTMGAGFLFGIGWGSVTMVVAETIAATLAFLIGRYLLPRHLRDKVRGHRAMTAIEGVVETESWQFIVLLRMIPFFPYKLSNYALGLTSVTLRDYVIGTAIGIVPITVFNVYIGSLASNLMSIGDGTGPQSTQEWLVYGATFTALGLGIMWLGRRANRRFNEIRDGAQQA